MVWGVNKDEEDMIAFEVYDKYVDAVFLHIDIFEKFCVA